jgi:hypothetical protein
MPEKLGPVLKKQYDQDHWREMLCHYTKLQTASIKINDLACEVQPDQSLRYIHSFVTGTLPIKRPRSVPINNVSLGL